jgi:hypothetical protein
MLTEIIKMLLKIVPEKRALRIREDSCGSKTRGLSDNNGIPFEAIERTQYARKYEVRNTEYEK